MFVNNSTRPHPTVQQIQIKRKLEKLLLRELCVSDLKILGVSLSNVSREVVDISGWLDANTRTSQSQVERL